MRLKPDKAAEVHTHLGRALVDKGDMDGAIAEFRTALRLKPDDADAHTALGEGLEAKGDLDGAIAEYRTVLQLQPDDFGTHRKIGLALKAKGDRDGAIAEYRAALRLKPKNTDHRILRADVRYRLERELRDKNAPLILKGMMLELKGDLDGAIAEFRTAVRLEPEDTDARSYLGRALEAKGDLEGAIVELSYLSDAALCLITIISEVTNSNLSANMHYVLGAVWMAKGLKKSAAQEFREYLRLVPDTPDNRERIQKARAWLRELEQ